MRERKLFALNIFILLGLMTFPLTQFAGCKLDSFDEYNILADPLCKAPCLLGITPGETNKERAIGNLTDYGIYPNCKITNETTNTTKVPMEEWQVRVKTQGIIICAGKDFSSLFIIYDSETKLVSQIVFELSRPIDLQDLIGIYGEPSTVEVFREPSYSSKAFALVYFDSILTELTLKGIDANNPKVDGKDLISSVAYVEEDFYYPEFMPQPWDGYGVHEIWD